MRTTKTIYYCDKCKKQIEEVHNVIDGEYYYELCNKCEYEYENYKEKKEKLYEAIDLLEQDYKFGKYLFKEIEKD